MFGKPEVGVEVLAEAKIGKRKMAEVKEKMPPPLLGAFSASLSLQTGAKLR